MNIQETVFLNYYINQKGKLGIFFIRSSLQLCLTCHLSDEYFKEFIYKFD